MNKGNLVNALLAKAGIGGAAKIDRIDALIQPITDTADALRVVQSQAYSRAAELRVAAVKLEQDAFTAEAEGDRAGRIALQIEQVVL